MGVQLLSESLVSVGKTESYQPEDALHEGLEPAAGGGRSRPGTDASGKWIANVAS